MELSVAFKKQAKKLGVSESYMVFADLLFLGYSDYDAYTIAFPENAALSAVRNRRIREDTLQSPTFKKLQEQRAEAHKHVTPTLTNTELMDKRETAEHIMRAAMAQPSDSKERIEGLMKYSDLMGYKKEEMAEEAVDNINFFFPLKCNQCPLLYAYNKAMEESGGEMLASVEMPKILEEAREIFEQVRKGG